MQVDPVDRAAADAASGILGVLPEVIAADAAVADEPFQGFEGELAAGIHAALADAVLVDLGRIDPVEPVRRCRRSVSVSASRAWAGVKASRRKGRTSRRRIETVMGD